MYETSSYCTKLNTHISEYELRLGANKGELKEKIGEAATEKKKNVNRQMKHFVSRNLFHLSCLFFFFFLIYFCPIVTQFCPSASYMSSIAKLGKEGSHASCEM